MPTPGFVGRDRTLTLTYALDADFADMFVVRGFAVGETGAVTDRVRTAGGLVVRYVRALLGIEPDIPNGKIVLAPSLPPWMNWMRVRRMRLGSGDLSFDVTRVGGRLSVRIETNTPGAEVRVQPTPTG